MSYFASSSHFYDCSGDSPAAAYDAGLKEARVRRLFPSPTTIESDIRSNKGLQIWKEGLLVDTVLANPQWHDETVADYKKRIGELARKPASTAADFGTLCHDAIEHFPTLPSDPSVMPWFEEYTKWHTENVDETLESEIMLAHHGIGVAGKADKFYLMKNGTLLCGDIKTQKVKPGKKPVPYESWARQLSFYAKSYAILRGIETPECANIIFDSQIPGPPTVKWWTKDEIQIAFQEFVAQAWLWAIQKDHWPVGRWEVTDFYNT